MSRVSPWLPGSETAPALLWLEGTGIHSRVSPARRGSWATPPGNPGDRSSWNRSCVYHGAEGGSRHQCQVVSVPGSPTPPWQESRRQPFPGDTPAWREGTRASRWTLWGPLRPASWTRGIGSHAHLSGELPRTQNAQSVAPHLPGLQGWAIPESTRLRRHRNKTPGRSRTLNGSGARCPVTRINYTRKGCFLQENWFSSLISSLRLSRPCQPHSD